MYVKIVDYKTTSAAKDFAQSMKETGFAVLSNHPISQDLVESVYGEWAEFFNSEDKIKYLFDPTVIRQAGYMPFKSENAKGYTSKDLKEFYHYREEKDLPAQMSGNTQELLSQMSTLGEEVLSWIEANLPEDIAKGLSCPLSDMPRGSDMTLLRILHYPPIIEENEENAVRAAAHEDINLLTILPAATAAGLQVKDSSGKWHDVPCDFGTLVFNIGDCLELATKGYFKSTTHRVVNPSGEEALKSRYSLPLFLHARQEVQISDTHTAGSALEERLRELGLMNKKAA